jgi:hypothetical protein
MSNFEKEFVSVDELQMLAESYTVMIHGLKKEIELTHVIADRKKLKLRLLDLMKRRYYIRICIKSRNYSQN